MRLSINFGNQTPCQHQCMGGSNSSMVMMAQILRMMMSMLMGMMGGEGGFWPKNGTVFPQQNPDFGGSHCDGGGCCSRSPLGDFLGAGGYPEMPGGFGHGNGGQQMLGGFSYTHGGGYGVGPGFGRDPAPGFGTGSLAGGGFQSNPEAGHPLSPRAVELIAKSEGFDQPGKWPGYQSGVTIGVGYDLGHCTGEQLYRDWKGKIPDVQLARLSSAIGLKGQSAKSVASQFSDIQIPQSAAMNVFHNSTLPKYYEQTREAFPGLERLPADAQGALTSIVFNRGAGMSGDRRMEMRQIRDAVAGYNGQGSLDYIAGRIQCMKRLWAGQGVDGLLSRRDREASLLQSSMYS